MTRVVLARLAMATRFEIVLHGSRESSLRAAGEEALDEIERLEQQLSLYRDSSDLNRINRLAAGQPVKVEPTLFRLIQHAAQLHAETLGTFDITIAPLMKAWGLMGGDGRIPDNATLETARACVGMPQVQLDPDTFTVRFSRPGIILDLGSIGKGHALDRAARVLREAGITSALLHGGTSTACGIGTPPDAPAWTVAIDHPNLPPQPGDPGSTDHPPDPLTLVELTNSTLSVSAVWGKFFQAQGTRYGHVMDPRTGTPVHGAVLAAVHCASATESDALSTALLTLGRPGIPQLHTLRPDLNCLVIEPDPNVPPTETRFVVSSHGFNLLESCRTRNRLHPCKNPTTG